MLAGNLRHDALYQAIEHTFDGQHPCNLCKAIADGKNSENKSEIAPLSKSLEFPPATEDVAWSAPAEYSLPSAAEIFPNPSAQTPPTPPPRALPALA